MTAAAPPPGPLSGAMVSIRQVAHDLGGGPHLHVVLTAICREHGLAVRTGAANYLTIEQAAWLKQRYRDRHAPYVREYRPRGQYRKRAGSSPAA